MLVHREIRYFICRRLGAPPVGGCWLESASRETETQGLFWTACLWELTPCFSSHSLHIYIGLSMTRDTASYLGQDVNMTLTQDSVGMFSTLDARHGSQASAGHLINSRAEA